MEVMGIDRQWQYEIFRLLAGILYLGNITFTVDAKDAASVADRQGTNPDNIYHQPHHFHLYLPVLDMFAFLIQSDGKISTLLHIHSIYIHIFIFTSSHPAASCSRALCTRTISTGTQGKSARVSTYNCPQNHDAVIIKKKNSRKFLEIFFFFFFFFCRLCIHVTPSPKLSIPAFLTGLSHA
jgi:hypothetical protein